MVELDPPAVDRFRFAVVDASQRRDVRDAVENVYRALQDQIDLRRPVCVTSGRCCRFEEFGHRLFVTTMEAASFLHELRSPPSACGLSGKAGCPFQAAKLCTVHSFRPFGCRIFFCDETSTEWQRQQYEFFHSEFKRLHEALAVPYFYVEWRQFLRTLRSNLSTADVSDSRLLPVGTFL